MSVKNQPRLNFTGVDVHSFNVVVHSQYIDAEIKHTIIPKIALDKDNPDNFKILMEVSLEAEDFFKIDALLSGMFVFNLEAADEYKSVFMHTNAPAIMFPYVRSFISTITANLGASTGTVIIPPQVFSGEIDILGSEIDS